MENSSYTHYMKESKKYKRYQEGYYKCLKAAYDIKPTGYVSYLLMLYWGDKKEYKESLKYAIKLFNNEGFKNDAYIYLILLSNFITIPKEIQAKLETLTYEDVALSENDDRFPHKEISNKVRNAIINKEYSLAFIYSQSIYEQDGKFTPQENFINKLLYLKCGKEKSVDQIKEQVFQECMTKVKEHAKKDRKIYFHNLLIAYDISGYDSLAYRLLVDYVSEENYEEAVKYAIILHDTSYNVNDINTYLLLLSQLTKLPQNVLDELANLTYENLEILETNIQYPQVELSNKIRRLILNKKFSEAYYYSQEIYNMSNNLISQDFLINKLLNKIKYNKLDNPLENEFKTYEDYINLASECFKKKDRQGFYDNMIKAYEVSGASYPAYRLLVNYVTDSNFKEALKYAIILYEKGNYRNDAYTYLILLSLYVPLPEDIEEEINSLTFDDIKISENDKRFPQLELSNKIRESIIEGKFREALNYSQESFRREGKFNSQDYLINRLLYIKYGKHYNLPELILDKRYQDAYDFINENKKLSGYNNIVKKLLELLFNIFDGAIYSENKKYYSTIEECIKNRAFQHVKHLNKDKYLAMLIDDIICYNNQNIINSASGNLSDTYYYFMNDIYMLIEKNNYEEAKMQISYYLDRIDEFKYNDIILHIFNALVKMNKEYEIINILADISYAEKKLDTSYLKELFEYAISNGLIDAAEDLRIVLTNILESKVDKDEKEYVLNLLNPKKTRDIYKTEAWINKVKNIVNEVKNKDEIQKLNVDNAIAAKVVEFELKHTNGISFVRINGKNPIVFYIKKYIEPTTKFTETENKSISYLDNNIQVIENKNENSLQSRILYKSQEAECQINNLIYTAKANIDANDYLTALYNLYNALGLSKEFNPLILSLIAFVYDKLNMSTKKDEINSIILNLEGINYLDVIEIAKYDYIINSKDSYNYGIADSIIEELISKELSTNDVLKKYNMELIDLAYAKAIAARKCYKENNLLRGDALLEEAYLLSENEELDLLIEEIGINKESYSLKDISFIDEVKKLVKKTEE